MGRKSTAKEDLIQAGMFLYHKYGFNEVSISQLCEAASVRPGTFFYFFKTKEAFTEQVLDRTWNEFYKFLLVPLSDTNVTPLQRIYEFLDNCYLFIKQQPSAFDCVVGCPFGNLILEVVPQNQVIHTRLIKALRDLTFILEKVIREAVDQNQITEDHPHDLAQMIISSIEGIWMHAKAYNDTELVKRLLMRSRQLLILHPKTL